MVHFKKILVPVDSSELSHRSLDTAFALAERFESLVIALSIRSAAADLAQNKVELELDVLEEQNAALHTQVMERARAFNLADDRVRAEVRAGPIVATIAEAAEEHMVDLVVMGTHGRQGLTELFTGSTTERVIAKLPMSVMAIKPLGFPYLRE